MNQEALYLINIIKYLLNEKIVDLPLPPTGIDWGKLLRLAQQHSIINLVHYGIEGLPEQHKPNDEIRQQLCNNQLYEIAKTYNQIEAAEELFNAFEKNGVCALAVKGICTKKRYPQVDMRTMGDIDILYKPSQQKAVRETMERLGYQQGSEERKHDSYHRKPYIGIEMHRALVAADSIYYKYYENIWDRVQLQSGRQYIYQMKPEDEFIFTMVHLTEHFQNGGIGIRFIMDVYVYNNVNSLDWNYIEVELRKLGLWYFYQNLSRLAHKWFGIKEENNEDSVLNKIETYIITGGTYGSDKNVAATAVAKQGRFMFLWKAMFPNLKNMQSVFPWLAKWPILLPYAWILRGVKSVRYRRKNIKIQLNRYQYGDMEYGKELRQFFGECGL